MQSSSLLVVDDSPYLHQMVRVYLQAEPVRVDSAYDGEAGLMLATALKPCLILLDIDMPQFSGLEVCRRLKCSPATHATPVIILSCEDSVDHKVAALNMGAVDYLTKPVRADELRARVRRALAAKRQLDLAAVHDPATGLWTRSFLDAVLPAHLSRARRHAEHLACLVAEIDSPEDVGVPCGAELGEHVIKGIASVLVEQSRSGDVLCHDGSGRFVALLPGTERAGAAHLAERIRKEIERQLHRVDGVDAGVTASFGVVDTEVHPTLLVSEAQAAAERARHAGGNLVVVARPPLAVHHRAA
jgi:diguanylate cyclase (GGDEF)-like protein